ncbi:MAG: hypothetical protein IJH75_08340 [Mogibacterium sp.]|nr:hypothetical protein [Mogibacterium sp.]
MYNRNGSGILGLLIGLIAFSVVISLVFSPAFWVIVAGLCLYSGYKRAKLRRQYREYVEQYEQAARGYGAYGGEQYGYGGYAERASQAPEGPSAVFEGEYTEGTDDPEVIEEVYESNAIDVNDFEVIRR